MTSGLKAILLQKRERLVTSAGSMASFSTGKFEISTTGGGLICSRRTPCSRLIKHKAPAGIREGLCLWGRLAVTYFRAGNPHYHRRRVVSPSCSGWEGVGPTRYGRQAKCWEVDAIRLRPALVGRVALTIWKKYNWVGSATQTLKVALASRTRL